MVSIVLFWWCCGFCPDDCFIFLGRGFVSNVVSGDVVVLFWLVWFCPDDCFIFLGWGFVSNVVSGDVVVLLWIVLFCYILFVYSVRYLCCLLKLNLGFIEFLGQNFCRTCEKMCPY